MSDPGSLVLVAQPGLLQNSVTCNYSAPVVVLRGGRLRSGPENNNKHKQRVARPLITFFTLISLISRQK